MSHLCTVADHLKQVHEYAGVCQLLCIACILYFTEPRCFCVPTDFQRLRQNYEDLTHANSYMTHSYTHSHTHTCIEFPLYVTQEKKKLNKN